MTILHFTIEVSRGGFIKWGADGRVDFVSPVPCPFNYGSVPTMMAEDGDPLDVIVLGPKRQRGSQGSLPVQGRVRFVDSGSRDDKWICSAAPISTRDRLMLMAFFAAYVRIKQIRGFVLGKKSSRLEGLEIFSKG